MIGHIATNITPDHKFAINMTRTKKHLRKFINFVKVVKKMVIPSLDVSNDKRTKFEKQTLNPKNKTNNNQPTQLLKKCLRTFSGTTKIYLINELTIPLSLHRNGFIETNPNLHKEKKFFPTKFLFT